MKKKNFVTLLMCVEGSLLLGMGMCMVLVPEMANFKAGIVVGVLGLIVMLAMVITRRIMNGKSAISFNPKAIAMTIFAIIGALVLGVGLCMTMIWNMLAPGIIVGIIGIILLISLIPATIGLK